MMRLKSASFVAALLLSLSISPVHAAVVNIINNDGPGEGFNDPTPVAPVGGNPGVTIGQQRLNAFQYAANIWGACIQSAVPINVRAAMNPLACNAGSAVLGSAGTIAVFRDFAGAIAPATWYPGALANALAGADLDPATPEISAQFNSNLGNVGCLTGIPFYYGLDQNPPVSTIDFVSVVLHEIGHGLGFQTFVASTGVKFMGFNDHYMVFLEHHGATPWMFVDMSDAQRAAAMIGDPNLHWNGPLVTARGEILLTAGSVLGHVRMHGPNPFAGGSSVSHWSTALTPNEIMEPSYTVANHNPGLAWALMDEIGWTLCTQPTNGCNGAVVDLAAPIPPPNVAGDDNQERGVFVTALKNFSLCSIGFEADFVPGETLNAYVYAASGTTRGALLASGSTTVQFNGNRTHYIPVSYTLEECKEYDLVVTWTTADTWPWWTELSLYRPYDVDGVIRVRDGESFGVAANFALGHFTIQGSSPTAPLQSDVAVGGNCNNTNGPEHGAFLTATKTFALSKLGVRIDYVNAPQAIRAYVYQSVGNVRGALVAEGNAIVPSSAGQVVTVPINALLKEGQQYDVGFQFGNPTDRYCNTTATPWQFSDLVRFDAMEVAGVVNGAVLQSVPAFEFNWTEGPALAGLDITAPWLGTPDGTSVFVGAFGKYVQALHNQELSGMGFYGDLAAGGAVTVNVYAAAGTVRGALISSGTITTGLPGLRWHDIPVAASLVSGQDYDLEIDWTGTTVNGFPYWENIGPGQPYGAYGLLKIIVGEFGGVPDALTECARYRVYSCPTGTLTAAGPSATPKFTLHDAYPNPLSATATMGFELDESAAVTVQVFDVAGRKVADVMTSRSLPRGPGEMTIDAKGLVSGVYFVKMSTPAKSVTRKITILR